MPIIEGTGTLKRWTGLYQFAVDGGAVGTIPFRTVDGSLPAGATIFGGYLEVEQVPTSGGAATIAVQAESAGDLQAAAAISGAPWSTTGRKNVTPAFTGATTIRTTATRNPAIVIGTAALTAGRIRLVLYWQ
jgi:hypothetical protein